MSVSVAKCHNSLLANMISSGELIDMDWEAKWEELLEGNSTPEEIRSELDNDLSMLWSAHDQSLVEEDRETAVILIESAIRLKTDTLAI